MQIDQIYENITDINFKDNYRIVVHLKRTVIFHIFDASKMFSLKCFFSQHDVILPVLNFVPIISLD